MTEIKTTNVKAEMHCHSDAGEAYLVTCPECKDEVLVAENSWWEQTCTCGFVWSVSVVATGTKTDGLT